MTIVEHHHLDIALKRNGWSGVLGQGYTKGRWTADYDTSSWLIVSTAHERTFDVHVPGEYEAGWTANLIEHLCKSSEEKFTLRAALESIGRATTLGEAQTVARAALNPRIEREIIREVLPSVSVTHC